MTNCALAKITFCLTKGAYQNLFEKINGIVTLGVKGGLINDVKVLVALF